MERAKFFPMIDVLRGFAALSVIVAHTIHHANWTSFPESGPLYWFRQGSFGVDLFFVISGFVIMYASAAMLDREKVSTFRIRFLINRFARIAPLYYLTLIVALFTIDKGILPHTSHILSHILFLHPLNSDWFSSINGPNWSVGIEMHFYLLMVLIAPLFLSRWKWVLILALFIIGLAWRYYAFVTTPNANEYRLFVLSVQLPGRLDAFGVGITLALFARTSTCKRVSEVWALPAALAGIFGLYLFFQWVWASGIRSLDFATSRLVISLAFSLLVLSAILITSPVVIRFSTPFRYLGTVSYGLYLWHLPVLLTVKNSNLPPALILAITILLTFVLASLSWHLLEQPIIKYCRYRSGQRRDVNGASIKEGGLNQKAAANAAVGS